MMLTGLKALNSSPLKFYTVAKSILEIRKEVEETPIRTDDIRKVLKICGQPNMQLTSDNLMLIKYCLWASKHLTPDNNPEIPFTNSEKQN